jgi:hypothetical protein
MMNEAELQSAAGPASADDFAELVAHHLAGELSDIQRGQLNAQLAAKPERCRQFVAMCIQAHLFATCIDPEFTAEEYLANCSDSDDLMPADPSSSILGRSVSMTWHRTVTSVFSGWPVAYLVATVVLGVGLLISSLTYVSQPVRITDAHSASIPNANASPATCVAQVTGIEECRWAKGVGPLYVDELVPLGRRIRIKSGLMEIAYKTGAKVILQGPATYEVDSHNGGYLSIGKLTGRVEVEKARGFLIRTPAATVTDLGTEFGVEVDREGNSEVDVLQGEVRLQVSNTGDRSPSEMRLGVGRSVRVDAARKTITDCPANRTQFVRRLTHDASEVISVNFTHGDKSNLDPTDRTGVVNATNWNNIDGSPIPAPTVGLHDAAGKPTGATITWQWSGPVKEPTYCNSDQMLDSRGMLFHGRFASGTNAATLKIRVKNVPFAHYRVYVYYWTEPSSDPAHLHTFGLSLNGSEPTIIGRSRTPLYHFVQYQNQSTSGNYQVFDGLSGDLSVVATPIGPAKYHELFLCGMQIVGTRDATESERSNSPIKANNGGDVKQK